MLLKAFEFDEVEPTPDWDVVMLHYRSKKEMPMTAVVQLWMRPGPSGSKQRRELER